MATGGGRLLLLLLIMDLWILCSNTSAPSFPQRTATETSSTAEPSSAALSDGGLSLPRSEIVSTDRVVVLTEANANTQERSTLPNLADVLKHLSFLLMKGRGRDIDGAPAVKRKHLNRHKVYDSRAASRDSKNFTTMSALRSTSASLKSKRIRCFSQSDDGRVKTRSTCLDTVVDTANNNGPKPRDWSLAQTPKNSDRLRREMTLHRNRQKQTKRKTGLRESLQRISLQMDKHIGFPGRRRKSVSPFQTQLNFYGDARIFNQILVQSAAFDAGFFQRHRKTPRPVNEPAAGTVPPEFLEPPDSSETTDQKSSHNVTDKQKTVEKGRARRLLSSKRPQKWKGARKHDNTPADDWSVSEPAAGTGNNLETDDGQIHDLKARTWNNLEKVLTEAFEPQQAFESDDDQRQSQIFNPGPRHTDDVLAPSKKRKPSVPLLQTKTPMKRVHLYSNATHFEQRLRDRGTSFRTFDSDDKTRVSPTKERSTKTRAARTPDPSSQLTNNLPYHRQKQLRVETESRKRSFAPRRRVKCSHLLNTLATQFSALPPGRRRRQVLRKSPDRSSESVTKYPAFSEQSIASDPLLHKASLRQGDLDFYIRNCQDETEGEEDDPESQYPDLLAEGKDSSDQTAQNGVQVYPESLTGEFAVDLNKEPVQPGLTEAYTKENDQHQSRDSFQRLQTSSENQAAQLLDDEDKERPYDDGTLFLQDDHAVEVPADKLQARHQLPSHLVLDARSNEPLKHQKNEKLDRVSQGHLQSSGWLFQDNFSVQKTSLDGAFSKSWHNDPEEDRIPVERSASFPVIPGVSRLLSLAATRVLTPHETVYNNMYDVETFNTSGVDNNFSRDSDNENSPPKWPDKNVSDTTRYILQRTNPPKHIVQHQDTGRDWPKVLFEDQDVEDVINVSDNAAHFLDCMLGTADSCRERLQDLVPTSPTSDVVHSLELPGMSTQKPDGPMSGRRPRRHFSKSKSALDSFAANDDLHIVQKRQSHGKGLKGSSRKKRDTGLSDAVTESDQMGDEVGLTFSRVYGSVRSQSKRSTQKSEHLRHRSTRQKRRKRQKYPRRLSKKRNTSKRTNFDETTTQKNMNPESQQQRANTGVIYGRYGRTHVKRIHELRKTRNRRIHKRSVTHKSTSSKLLMPSRSARSPGQAGTLLDPGAVRGSVSIVARSASKIPVQSAVSSRIFSRADRPGFLRTEERPLAAKRSHKTFFDLAVETPPGKLDFPPAVYAVAKPLRQSDKHLDSDITQAILLSAESEAELNGDWQWTKDRSRAVSADQTARWNETEENLDRPTAMDQSRPRRSWEPVTNAISCSPRDIRYLNNIYRQSRQRNRELLSLCF